MTFVRVSFFLKRNAAIRSLDIGVLSCCYVCFVIGWIWNKLKETLLCLWYVIGWEIFSVQYLTLSLVCHWMRHIQCAVPYIVSGMSLDETYSVCSTLLCLCYVIGWDIFSVQYLTLSLVRQHAVLDFV